MTRRTLRRNLRSGAGLATAAVLTATMLAGCGGDDSDDSDDSDSGGDASESAEPGFTDEDPADILEAGLDATRDADSLRLQGTADSDGTEVDLVSTADGSCEGTISVEGVEADILGVEGSYWLRGNDEFWDYASDGEATQAQLDLIIDEWVVADTFDELTSVCSPEGIIDEFSGELSDPEAGDTVDTDSGEAIEVQGTDDEDDVVVQVLTAEPHYIVAFQSDDVDLTASDYDEDVDIEAPDEADIVTQEDITNAR